MASPESLRLREMYVDWTERLAANPETTMSQLRAVFEEWHLATKEPVGVTYECVTAGAVEAMWCTPVDGRNDAAVLYMHGGGFSVGSMHSHRKLAGHIAKGAGCRALVTNYRLAPEHPFPSGIEDNVAAYRWLLDQGLDSHAIAFCGDSAGGTLALTTAVMARGHGLPLPAAIAVMSPLCDPEGSGETMESRAHVDALVNREITVAMCTRFLGEGGDPRSGLVNPLCADLSGFPPLHIEVGDHETLLDDSRRLAAAAANAGVTVTLSEVGEMQHVFPFLAGRCPEADEAVARIGTHLRRYLARP